MLFPRAVTALPLILAAHLATLVTACGGDASGTSPVDDSLGGETATGGQKATGSGGVDSTDPEENPKTTGGTQGLGGSNDNAGSGSSDGNNNTGGNTMAEPECDPGETDCETLPGQECNDQGQWESSNVCSAPSECGDNKIDASTEACDDGNTVSENECAYGQASCVTCNADCSATLNLVGAVCGDGRIDDGKEICDDGNTITETSCPEGVDSCTACSSDCAAQIPIVGFCGNGVSNWREGESCDTGAERNDSCVYGDKECLPCSTYCQRLNNKVTYCGDGTIQAGEGEVCDDGNDVNTDSCTNSCSPGPDIQPCTTLGLTNGCFDASGEFEIVVPSGVTSARIKAWGAGGGNGSQVRSRGGAGAFVSGVLSVVPTTTLQLAVGEGGSYGGGGGASLVYQAGTIVLVAGAGGGGGSDGCSGCLVGGQGGAGGIERGQNGSAFDVRFATRYAERADGGTGGTQTAGGIGGLVEGAGTSSVASVCVGGNGAAFTGGSVSAGWGCAEQTSKASYYRTGGGGSNGDGGGGGAGYFGGGAGGAIWTYAGGGGGGGSSYVAPQITQVETEAGVGDAPGRASVSGGAGYNTKAGLIVVEWL